MWLPTRIVSYQPTARHLADVPAPDGVPLHVESFGSGEPVTVFAAGLGGTIAETRTLGSGVAGTRVFFDFRGHGASGSPAHGGWSYDALAGDLRAVADATGATRAVGVSMGAAAVMGVVAETPERFSRLVFFLPAILDQPRRDVATGRLGRVAARIEAGDDGAVAELLMAEVPAALRSAPGVDAYVRDRARALSGRAVAGLVRALAETRPVRDRVALAAVGAPSLVIGQEGDEVHPAGVARALAATLPNARLHVFDAPGGLWAHRAALRPLLAAFLDG
jgi:pimeloyl-ACP methyl ester carboxylesterase